MDNNHPEIKLLDYENKLDNTTKLNLMRFFLAQYDDYNRIYPNSNLVFIDFSKLKKINDEFTHKGGNKCLESFAIILKKIFPDSLIARKHGDEFLLLTHHSDRELKSLFEKCKIEIRKHFDLNMIPVIYEFNAGAVSAEEDADATIDKADIMMYEAKKEELTFLYFNQNRYDEVKKNQKFILDTSEAIKLNELILVKRSIYDVNKNSTNIFDFHTRNLDNKSLFTDHNLKLLRESCVIKKLDYLNLKKIILFSKIPNGYKAMINIHANSLFNVGNPFPKYIKEISNNMKDNNPNNYIICINVIGFSDNVDKLIYYMDLLQNYNFEIALSGFDLSRCNILLNIWAKINVEYVKINAELWKEARLNKKYASILKNTLQTFFENKTIPIFMKVETQEELNFIKDLSPQNLVEGNFIDIEEKIVYEK